MKKLFKYLLIIVFCFATFSVSADIIITKEGKTIEVHNIEISTNWIFYTNESSANAPIQKMSKADVFAVKIGNSDLIQVNAEKD